MVFFIKYEFWYNYLTYLKQWNKRTYQVSLILRQDHYLLKPYSKWFRGKLSAFSHFFVQNEQTADLLRSIGYTNCSVCGDTRFDRVAQIAQHTQDIKIIEQFCASSNVLLLGSSWEEDERILQKAISGIANLKIIITPHQIHSSHLDYILSLFPSAILYTDLTQENINQSNIIIINCIGILSSLYKHCTLAYIGGGFGEGIHNTLEAAVFGKPICFGPNYHKFKEAVDLIAGGGARSIENEEDLKHFLNLLQDEQAYNQASSFCTNYVQNNIGASQRVMTHVQKDYDRVAEILSNR
jgi:3-deoxy-D-manno-octulosonic-acid transferase